MKRTRAPRPPSAAVSVALAVVGPGAAIGLGLAIDRRSLAGATSLALLAVVVAAAFGGRRSGLTAAVIAFFSLNFFFTPPYHTITVHRLGDVIALFVFLVVSVVVGALFARAVEGRERAERRVVEASFFDRITTRLGSGEPIEKVLEEVAGDLVAMFDLLRCEIRLSGRDDSVAVRSGESSMADGPRVILPMSVTSAAVGSIVAIRGAGRSPYSSVEQSFLQALAAQTAMAVERASLDEEIHRARLQAEASALRAALFSSVTHDLRTPLASIKAGASGLLDGSASYTPAQREEMLRTIVEESDRLNRIVANLLDLARMRAGALEPSREPVWLQDLMNAALARMRRRLESFSVRVTIRPDLPAVSGDSMQLDQVITNIIENAARFSPPGEEIVISAARWQDEIQVRVMDRGPGIPPDERTKIFEEFYRKDAGVGRGGTGLGLAIARAIVLGHGGRIWAEGSAGGGATIIFELPIASGVNSQAEASEVSEALP